MFQRITKVFSAAAPAILLVSCMQSPTVQSAQPAPAQSPAVAKEEPVVAKPKSCPLSLPNQGFCASLTWDRQPTEDEGGIFTLRFWKSADGSESGPYVSPPFTVAVKLWMASMGHGSSPVRVAQTKDQGGVEIPGVYTASDVYFSMPGEWEIWVQLKQNKQVIEQAKLDFKP